MIGVVGTVPNRNFPLVAGETRLKDDRIHIRGNQIPVNRGTPALLAATIKTAQVLEQDAPFAYLVGDVGLGHGSRRLYEYLSENLGKRNFDTIAFHYLQPDVDWHNRVLFAVEEMEASAGLDCGCGFHVRGQNERAGFSI